MTITCLLTVTDIPHAYPHCSDDAIKAAEATGAATFLYGRSYEVYAICTVSEEFMTAGYFQQITFALSKQCTSILTFNAPCLPPSISAHYVHSANNLMCLWPPYTAACTT